MKHRSIGNISCVTLIGYLMACSSEDKSSDGDTGGTNSSTVPVSLGDGGSSASGGAAFGTATSVLPDATTTENGTQSIDAAKAAAIIEDPSAACAGWGVEAEAEKSVIYFLVDVSGSMGLTAPSTNGDTKWNVTRAALKTAIGRLPTAFGVGVAFYPNMKVNPMLDEAREPTACVDSSGNVPLALATTEQQNKVVSALDGMTPFDTAATPTHDAYKLAVTELAGTTLLGRKYLAFITDGQPTQSEGCIGSGQMCEPTLTEPIVASIKSAFADSSIQTFIVGSPGSEANACTKADVRDWLSLAARAGNTAPASCTDTVAPYCHFDLSQSTDFGTALSDALSNITKSLISCKYAVPTPPNSATLANGNVNMVFQSGTGDYLMVLPNSDGTCTSNKGWAYTDASKTEVEICGTTCDLLQNDPTAKLNIVFGCALNVWTPPTT